MEGKITAGQLHVKCRFQFLNITQCRIHARYGSHTTARVSGIVKGGEAEKALADISKEKLEISCRDDSGTEKILFVGMVSQADYTQESGFATLSLQAVSYSYKTDIRKKTRSFQSLALTYQDVAGEVLSEYGGSIRFHVPDKKLDYPLIQYNETDFGFLKRILSYIGAGITAGDVYGKVRLSAGIPEGGRKPEIDLAGHPHSQIPYKKKGKMTGHAGYEIWDMDDMRVGDAATIHGKTLYVMEEELVLKDGIFNGRLLLFPKACFTEHKIAADTLAGTVLTGTVLKTEQEMVRLKLDIDEEQDEKEAYPYPWRPITGNFLYCMPEPGTKAGLYFGEAEEGTGMAIYNIRRNGDASDDYKDYEDRRFHTAKRKYMYLNPSSIGLSSASGQGGSISLSDETRAIVSSGSQMSILAEGPVTLRGENVVFRAPKEATLVRKDQVSPTVINLCNAFDAIGKVGGFAATPQEGEKKEKEKDAGKTNRQEKTEYSIAGAVADILSNIPADTGGNAALDKVAAAMPWLV